MIKKQTSVELLQQILQARSTIVKNSITYKQAWTSETKYFEQLVNQYLKEQEISDKQARKRVRDFRKRQVEIEAGKLEHCKDCKTFETCDFKDQMTSFRPEHTCKNFKNKMEFTEIWTDAIEKMITNKKGGEDGTNNKNSNQS